MTKDLKILIAIVLAVGIAALVATKIYRASSSVQESASEIRSQAVSSEVASSNSSDESPGQKLIRSDSHSLGPAMARVTIVEFLDPECESCKAFFPVVKQLLKENEGRVHFVVRYMGFHKSSAMAVAATEAAGLQGKYWEMQELLFDKAEEWGHKPVPDEAFFIKYAKSFGLDIARFRNDLADPQWLRKLERDMEDGKALGVRGTPTVFINGRRLQELSYEALDAEVKMAFAGE